MTEQIKNLAISDVYTEEQLTKVCELTNTKGDLVAFVNERGIVYYSSITRRYLDWEAQDYGHCTFLTYAEFIAEYDKDQIHEEYTTYTKAELAIELASNHGVKYESSTGSICMFSCNTDESYDPFRYLGQLEGSPANTSMKMSWIDTKWRKYVEPIPDKSPVWCWDNCNPSVRTLMFYDRNNERLFRPDGKRYGVKKDHYEVYPHKDAWIEKAQQSLQD